METRVAVISIIVENPEAVHEVNDILHTYGEYIIGRMGIPYRAKGINIISIAIDAPQDVIQEGKRLMSKLIKECQENTQGHCKGVFYWEPECKPSQYKLGAFTEDGRPTRIMDAFKE